MSDATLILATERLALSTLTVEDAAFILDLVNQPSFLANIGDKGVRTLDDAKVFILDGPWRRGQPPGCGQFLVRLKADGTAIGVSGLLYRERIDVVDVGGAFLPEFQQQGYGLEAARALIEYGKTTLGVREIVALTSEENEASIALLAKLGMSFDRIVRMTDDDPGTALYS
ncbi:MAG: GNAT family N-acetyltransferase [Thermoanaerobaculales bacterium]|nr:GNAT family N-acetyltransferase [Thermoanaerobaculales bacterium]